MDESANRVARNALLLANSLAALGALLGLVGVWMGDLSRTEAVLISCSFVFCVSSILFLLSSRRRWTQPLATAGTVFYIVYLLACLVATVQGPVNNLSFFVYLSWFFPLLVFNKLVNSPAVNRVFSWIILVAPPVAVFCLLPRLISIFSRGSWFLLIAMLLGYSCYGLMLNYVGRYREEYIVQRERVETLKVEAEILESITDGFISLDKDLRLTYMNEGACSELDIPVQVGRQGPFPDSIFDFFSEEMLRGLKDAYGKRHATTFEAHDPKNERWYVMRCFPRVDGGLLVYFRNVTETVLDRRKLDAATDVLRERSELLDKAKDAIFVTDMDARIRYWNKGAERLLGYTSDEVVGKLATELFEESRDQIAVAVNEVNLNGEFAGEMTKRDKSGRWLTVDASSTLVRAPDGTPKGVLIIHTDITARKAAQNRIQHLAFYDGLTNLANRVLLRDQIEQALNSARLHGQSGALLMIDLDDFKTLNDTSGHVVGDQLLKQVARRIEGCVGDRGIVARFGGDEFVVLLNGLASDRMAHTKAREIGEVIQRSTRRPYRLRGSVHQGTTSMGITLLRTGKDSVDDLLRRADLAMHSAKDLGRNTICFFDPAMEEGVAARAELQADIRRALKNGEFELYYQPQLDYQRGVIGAEGLLRWNHPHRGLVFPQTFIPIAEDAGLISELGCRVIDFACRQLAIWAKSPQFRNLVLSINVSPRQFQDPTLVRRVEQALRRSQVDPGRLKLEITEGVAMQKIKETIATMKSLKELGVGLALDDFGTGYSSLSRLKELPLDQLKIDQSFVRDVRNSDMDASIVRTIIALAKSLRLAVIAEGVETQEQREFLEREGCHTYQGFLFSRAVPASEFESYVLASVQPDFRALLCPRQVSAQIVTFPAR